MHVVRACVFVQRELFVMCTERNRGRLDAVEVEMEEDGGNRGNSDNPCSTIVVYLTLCDVVRPVLA